MLRVILLAASCLLAVGCISAYAPSVDIEKLLTDSARDPEVAAVPQPLTPSEIAKAWTTDTETHASRIADFFFGEPNPRDVPNAQGQIQRVLIWRFSDPEPIENQYRVVAMASVPGIGYAGKAYYFSVLFVLTIEGQQVVDWTIDRFAKIECPRWSAGSPTFRATA